LIKHKRTPKVFALSISSPVTGEPEQHQEQVDEVKIEGQGTDDGRLSPLNTLSGHFLDFPGIVCGQAGEDKNSYSGYNPLTEASGADRSRIL
jgi:hypothetical protein